MLRQVKLYLKLALKLLADLLLITPFFIIAMVSRFWRARVVDVGLGPEPLVNYIYHKRALECRNYSAETYVAYTYYVTDGFDYCFSQSPLLSLFRWHLLFLRAIFRYRCLYFSFHGGPLMGTTLLRILEPYLLKLAGIKTVVLPYGSDVQDMSRCPNLSFKHALAMDYPTVKGNRRRIARQIDRWTRHADHIVAGCDWVDYIYHWDTISLSNFSIDTEFWAPPEREAADDAGKTIRILHAPNHRTIKGTEFFVRAVDELRQEGHDVELIVLERQSNEEIRQAMARADIVADQLVIGWYAMFSMESMALGKPVLCHIREDLKSLYVQAGLIEEDELPLVECSPSTVKEVIRGLVQDRESMADIGRRSRDFVVKHHALPVIGAVFDRINRQIGLSSSRSDAAA